MAGKQMSSTVSAQPAVQARDIRDVRGLMALLAIVTSAWPMQMLAHSAGAAIKHTRPNFWRLKSTFEIKPTVTSTPLQPKHRSPLKQMCACWYQRNWLPQITSDPRQNVLGLPPFSASLEHYCSL